MFRLFKEIHIIDRNCLSFSAKVRRLYDIANILTSMNLIQKTVTYAGSRKAAFKWIGVDLDDIIPDTGDYLSY